MGDFVIGRTRTGHSYVYIWPISVYSQIYFIGTLTAPILTRYTDVSGNFVNLFTAFLFYIWFQIALGLVKHG